jgi:mycothiol synthase
MKSHLLQTQSDLQSMRNLMAHLRHHATVIDFEETMQLASVRAATRLWEENGQLIGFALVDHYDNLCFEIDPDQRSTQLENEIMQWGITCLQKRNAESGEDHTLEASFSTDNSWQIAMLERFGFVREDICSLHYTRSLDQPIVEHAFPPGFSLRCVAGEGEVEALVQLHRAAFGTQNMTVEERLAIMHAPHYERELDLLAVTPDGDLAAFCICEFEDEQLAYTDPIGVHPHYHKLGLGQAIVTAGLLALKARGARFAKLGTSSHNIAMQKLAESLGFVVTSESLWFSKKVS